MLAFQKCRNLIIRECLAYVLDNEFHHAVKKILLVDAVTLHNIAGDHGVVDAVSDLIGALRVILLVISLLLKREDRIKGYGLELPNIQKDADKVLAEEMIGEGQR